MSRSASEYPNGAAITIDRLEEDPHPHLAFLRATEPVTWIPAFEGWFVTGRDLAIAAMRDAVTFTVDDPRFSTAQVIGPSMLSLDGAEHSRHRTPFLGSFKSGDVKENLKEGITRRAAALLRDLAPKGEGDLRQDYAVPLAVEVMTDILGLIDVESDLLWAWYRSIVGAVDAVTAGDSVPESGTSAFEELRKAVRLSMAKNPESLPAKVAGSGDLEPEEIVSNVAVLLFGGIVTSEATTSTVLHQLLLNPDQLEMVRGDRSLVPAAVEEGLRYEPAASVVDRYATRDTVLGEAAISSGDLVRISLAAPNRDPDVFPDPNRFDVLRPNANQHLAFARGPHACLGLHLARLETAVALGALLDDLDDLELVPERSRSPSGLVFRGPDSVHARWST